MKGFSEFGLMGLVLGTMIWNNITLQKRMMQLIENNTAALTALRDHCKQMNGDGK